MRVELPIVSFISAMLVLFPLPWHWKARNICIIALIFWLVGCNIAQGVNSIIWRDNVTVQYEVWCDIVVKLVLGGNIGVPASILCMNRRMARVSAPHCKTLSPRDKLQRRRFEIGMCVILPVIVMTLHPVVQSYRFNIDEVLGCAPSVYISVPSLFIISAPPLLLSLVGSVYSGVALRWLIHRRAQFQQSPWYTKSIPASGPYLRLVSLAITQMTFTTAISLFALVNLFQFGLLPWTSWAAVHEHWSEIALETKDSMPDFYWRLRMVAWYFVPFTSVIFFGYFGFENRTVAVYKDILSRIKARIFCIKSETTTVLAPSGHNSIPAHEPAVVVRTPTSVSELSSSVKVVNGQNDLLVSLRHNER